MKKLSILFGVFALSLVLMIIIICYPQLYYFDNKLKFKQFNVYSDKPFTKETYMVFNKVESLIKKSEIYDPHLTFTVFLRSAYSIHNTVPWQFSETGYGITRPIIRNIFISKADVNSNSAYRSIGGIRPLDVIITHEIVHILIENKFNFSKPTFAEDRSKMGLFWKDEGYAEYIAGQTALNLQDGLSILQGKYHGDYNLYDLEYFKCELAVKYLIEKKKMNITELMNIQLNFDEVLNEAINDISFFYFE